MNLSGSTFLLLNDRWGAIEHRLSSYSLARIDSSEPGAIFAVSRTSSAFSPNRTASPSLGRTVSAGSSSVMKMQHSAAAV